MLGPSGKTPALRLVDDAGREHAQLAVVLVSNNPYALDGPVPGTRPSLDSGLLGILILDTPGNRHPPGRAWSAPDFEVSAPAPAHAGIDGEAVMLNAPLLRFTIRPAALRVRISSQTSRRRAISAPPTSRLTQRRVSEQSRGGFRVDGSRATLTEFARDLVGFDLAAVWRLRLTRTELEGATDRATAERLGSILNNLPIARYSASQRTVVAVAEYDPRQRPRPGLR